MKFAFDFDCRGRLGKDVTMQEKQEVSPNLSQCHEVPFTIFKG